ncbi:hypothetical protein [Aureispira anguillae]|nr:hypothetical protein [Aureispira anguillae]
MKSYLFTCIALATSLTYFLSSCTDKLPEPVVSLDCSTVNITYVGHVKGILDAKCNLAGCHDDNGLASFGTYSSLNTARMEAIYDRVCVKKDMPPAGMATEKVDSIRCWAENGYLEN